jgi:hypothetical protein
LLVSTIFTILLIPLLLSLVMDFQQYLGDRRSQPRTRTAVKRRPRERDAAAAIPAGAPDA